MYRSSSMETREIEYKEIVLLGLIICKTLNYTNLRTSFWIRVLLYDPMGGIHGVNVYVIVMNLINRSHVQWVTIHIYNGDYSHHWDMNMWFGMYELIRVFGGDYYIL